MFLEEWTHKRIRLQAKNDPECRNQLRGDLQHITADTLRDFQLFKLQRALNHVYQNSSFYRELYDSNNFTPEDLKSLDDMAKIPLTTAENLWESPYRLLCVSLTEIDRIFTRVTSGTTGHPKRILFSGDDLEIITDGMVPMIQTPLSFCGIPHQGCKVQIFLANGTELSQVHLVSKGVEKMGGVPARGDIFASTDDQISSILAARPTMLMGSATRIYRITQEARQSLDLPSLGIKVLFITSEYLSPPMRENLASFWKADVFHHYGMTETGLAGAIECNAHDGYHFNEADFLFEVVDPQTGRSLPDEQEGELVFTSLSRRAMPLLRYRTGDIAKLIVDPCKCGTSTGRRIGRITKRVGGMVEIAEGRAIYPSLFDDKLYAFKELVDYRIILTREGDKEALSCKVELIEENAALEEDLASAIASIDPINRSIKDGLLATPKIEFAQCGEITRTGRMKQRIIDERQPV